MRSRHGASAASARAHAGDGDDGVRFGLAVDVDIDGTAAQQWLADVGGCSLSSPGTCGAVT